ncbi:DapH/DapD/GlmU-related protein [Polaribacter sp. Hel1_33_49]|jgi:acetyltransferase-like isoleucine patch superfamily enzyme|uniref:acyltransferase n=1 Tax=Polaribacter sp. Hel1_33_49 TaxID=1336803 RepID=UPI00052BE6FF|nr:acyltransferase [Polaribacter sp. Hel1_33_49]KGL60301.1 galactoside O-acetyltransferase [Polaribacter sp. Hel1_33_49]
MRKIINRLISLLGKKGYSIDENLSILNLISIILSKILPIIRGFILKFSLKSSKGIVFLGKNSKIKFKSNIIFGNTVQIGDNVEINALSKSGVVIGDNFSILRNSIIECTGVISELGEGIVIGNNVGIAQNCFIQVRGRVIIGNNVIFGPNVSIFSENHNFEDISIPIKNQGTTRMGVIIEDDVWLGSGSKVLDGVKIGHGSIIAAGAIVNHNVPPFSIVGGIPGKVLKYRM